MFDRWKTVVGLWRVKVFEIDSNCDVGDGRGVGGAVVNALGLRSGGGVFESRQCEGRGFCCQWRAHCGKTSMNCFAGGQFAEKRHMRCMV